MRVLRRLHPLGPLKQNERVHAGDQHRPPSAILGSMREVEYFLWTLPPDAWRKKPHPSKFKMTREEAQKRHPGATPILESREVRQMPETEEEILKAKLSGMTSPAMPGSAAWKRIHGD